MKCPFCGFYETKVVDSRPTDEGRTIRRRRECSKCEKRFTTYEKMEETPLIVVKKDNTREAFNREKILSGIVRACEKRPVTVKQMDDIVDQVEAMLQNAMNREVASTEIGEIVMKALKDIDEVSYVRFASVYRQFRDLNSFMEEVKKILDEK
ncbi:MAG: transcriptional regulator NrdR [Tissierellales bacterium]|nr:transcriptional regulator NrdR [Tissierellales bacterium]